VFCPTYLTASPSDANWEKDKASLDSLQQKGVSDLIIQPSGSAIDAPAAAWQKVVDYLDQHNFRYAIGFGKGVPNPLVGTVIRPASYRIAGVEANQDVSWEVPDADSANFVFASDVDGSRIEHGGSIRIRDGAALVPGTKRLNGTAVAILYPHRSLAVGSGNSIPDLWVGFDNYRDKVIHLLSTVKFGPGLRFFLDPLGHQLGLSDEADYLIPDSPIFRMEWEAYLTRKYPSISRLNAAWSIQEGEAAKYKDAARLIPLWSSNKGVPYLMDQVTGRMSKVADNSRFWTDFHEYRNDAISYYMNTIADVLKREVANVPVVYTHTKHHRMFTNAAEVGGFDGLGVAAYGRGSALVTGGADAAYSQVQESGKALWCIVTEMLDANIGAKSQNGYGTKQALFYDLDWLRGIGAKGFFINGFQVTPATGAQHTQFLNTPEQLDWMKEYGTRLSTDSGLIHAQPKVLPFPERVAGLVHPGPIGNTGVWWVPSLLVGRPMSYGASYAGYTMDAPEGDTLVIWSLRGVRETHLAVKDPKRVQAYSVDGTPLKFKIDPKKKVCSIKIDEIPVVFRTGGQEMYPVEAIEDTLSEAGVLIKKGKADKQPVDTLDLGLTRAETNYRHGDMGMAMSMASNVLGQLIELMQPYSWIEVEGAEAHTFSEAASIPSASNSSVLQLNTTSRPPREGYTVQIKFTVPEDDKYTFWLSGTPPGQGASPFAWVIDTGDPVTSDLATLSGTSFLSDQLVWMNLGQQPLKRGRHTITLKVTDRAAALNAYYLVLDSLLITRYGFVPSGVIRPKIDANYLAKAAGPPPVKK
jgi:hypothetical protein